MNDRDDFGWQQEELLKPGLVVEDDRPGSRLRLAWQGRPPRASLRRLGAAALAIVCLGGAGAVFYAATPQGANPPAFGNLALVGVISLFGAAFVYQAASFWASLVSYWESFDWDAGELTFVARRRGWLVWGGQTETIPLASIRSISFSLGSEGRGAVPIKLSLTFDKDDSWRWFDAELTSLGWLKRSEAIALLFSIGRVARSAGYAVGENNLQRQVVQVWRKGADAFEEDEFDDEEEMKDGGLQPIPPPEDAAAVAAELTPRKSAGEAVVAKTSFDAEKFAEKFEFTRIEDWRPGEKICIVSPQAPAGVFVFLILLAAIAAGLAGAFPVWGGIGSFVGGDALGRYATAACTALFGGCLALFLSWNNLQRRELTFEWLDKQATWRVGSSIASWPLGAIQGFVLTEVRASGEKGATEYRHQLTMIAPDRDVPVAKTEKDLPTAELSYDLLGPLAADLAAALDTKCLRTSSSAGADLAQKLWLTGRQKTVLAALAAAMAVMFLSAAVPQFLEGRAAARLASLGLEIAMMGSFTRNDELIGENYWTIKVKEGATLPRLDDEAKRLLAGLRKVGLDAEGSNLTDDDLIGLGDVQWSIVDVSQTAVTDRGIAALAASENLSYLDAYDSRVGDEAMAALAHSPRLRYLFLPGARVTDAGLKPLESIDTLKIVHLGGCPVTETGVDALRRALPGAKVTFK